MGNRTGVRILSPTRLQLEFKDFNNKPHRERIKIDTTNKKNIALWIGNKIKIDDEVQRRVFKYKEWFPAGKYAHKFCEWQGEVKIAVDVFREWLDIFSHKYQKGTIDNHAGVINMIENVYDKMTLIEFTPPMFYQLSNQIYFWQQKRSNDILSMIRQAMSMAVGRGYIKENLFYRWHCASETPAKNKEQIEPFNAEELKKLYTAAKLELRCYIQFSTWTGLRPQEVIPLIWPDIDFKNKLIHIRRTEVNGVIRLAGKTENSLRTIPLLEPAEIALKQLREYYIKNNINPNDIFQGIIFTNPVTGEPWHFAKRIQSHFIRLCESAGVRYRKPYTTRHSFCSMMLNSKADKVWLARVMGHADFGMIDRIYGHFMEQPTFATEGQAAVDIFWES